MNRTIPLSIPNITQVEKDYVIQALDDGWISSVGPHVELFETKFAEYLGAGFAVACNSGTSALHIALLLQDVQIGDEVLVPNITFVATANAVSYLGAVPILLDVNPNTLGICEKSLENFITEFTEMRDDKLINKVSGRCVKAILPVHMLGTPVDMQAINTICNTYKIKVIEDATESLGSKYYGKKTGLFSKISCFSFNGNKLITTGGGGMIVTNDKELATRAKHLTTTAKTDPVFFFHDEVGYNYRMVNILAAIGLGQLSRIEDFLSKKHHIHTKYKKGLMSNAEVDLFQPMEGFESNYWLNLVTFKSLFDISNHTLRSLVEHFQSKGIQTRPIWTLLNKLPMYQENQFVSLSKSEEVYSRSLMLPSCTSMTNEEIDFIVNEINAIS